MLLPRQSPWRPSAEEALLRQIQRSAGFGGLLGEGSGGVGRGELRLGAIPMAGGVAAGRRSGGRRCGERVAWGAAGAHPGVLYVSEGNTFYMLNLLCVGKLL
jgi:hypothetical protein